MSNYLYSPGCVKGASSLPLPWKPSPSTSSQPVSCGSAEAHISNGTGCLNLPISIASQPRCFSQRHSLYSERVSIRGSFNPLNLSKPSTSQVAHFNNGIFKSLCKSPAPLSNKGVGFKSHTGKIWYRSSDSSRRDSNSGRGKGLERSHSKREQNDNVPSSQKKFGRSSSFNLFVDRTKDAVMWSSKRSRSTSGERQQRHSPTSDKQYEVERSSVASGMRIFIPNWLTYREEGILNHCFMMPVQVLLYSNFITLYASMQLYWLKHLQHLLQCGSSHSHMLRSQHSPLFFSATILGIFSTQLLMLGFWR